MAKYEERFTSAKTLAALHDAYSDCFHFGCQFWTSRPAFQLTLERALLAMDPSLAVSSWDWLTDSAACWATSLRNTQSSAPTTGSAT